MPLSLSHNDDVPSDMTQTHYNVRRSREHSSREMLSWSRIAFDDSVCMCFLFVNGREFLKPMAVSCSGRSLHGGVGFVFIAFMLQADNVLGTNSGLRDRLTFLVKCATCRLSSMSS
jgi:hypothetical protein